MLNLISPDPEPTLPAPPANTPLISAQIFKSGVESKQGINAKAYVPYSAIPNLLVTLRAGIFTRVYRRIVNSPLRCATAASKTYTLSGLFSSDRISKLWGRVVLNITPNCLHYQIWIRKKDFSNLLFIFSYNVVKENKFLNKEKLLK